MGLQSDALIPVEAEGGERSLVDTKRNRYLGFNHKE